MTRATSAPASRAREATATHAVAGLSIPDELLEQLAALVAERVAAELGSSREPWMTAEEAMVYLSCPRSRIDDLVRLRRVRFFRDGRRLLFRRSDLDDALEVSERA